MTRFLRCCLLTDLTIMDWRWHAAGHYDIAAEVLMDQVRVQRVRCMWRLIGRTWDTTRKYKVSHPLQHAHVTPTFPTFCTEKVKWSNDLNFGDCILLRMVTSKKHFLQQVVNLGHAKEFDELDLLNHLPSDALQCWQQQEQLSKAAPGVVLPVVDVVLQADLDLVSHPFDLSRVTQTFSIWGQIKHRVFRERSNDYWFTYRMFFKIVLVSFGMVPRPAAVPGSKKTMAFRQAYSLSSIWSSWKGSTSSSRILTATLPTSSSGQFLGMM